MTILLVTNRQDYTADFVVLELQRRGADYLRLNTEDIPSAVGVSWLLDDAADGSLIFGSKTLTLSEVTSIWYRRPVLPVPSNAIVDPLARRFVINETRSAIGGILRQLDCVWVSHPDSLLKASFKLSQLTAATRIGLMVPETIVTNVPDSARSFIEALPERDAVFKPISLTRIEGEAESNGKLIFTSRITEEQFPDLRLIEHSPSMFQRHINKAADLRVTVIGDAVFAVEIDSQAEGQSKVDWRRGDIAKMRHSPIELPIEIRDKCSRLVADLGLKFGAIDLIRTPSGEHYFLEINPVGQWAWLEQLTRLPLTSTLVNLLQGLETSQT